MYTVEQKLLLRVLLALNSDRILHDVFTGIKYFKHWAPQLGRVLTNFRKRIKRGILGGNYSFFCVSFA